MKNFFLAFFQTHKFRIIFIELPKYSMVVQSHFFFFGRKNPSYMSIIGSTSQKYNITMVRTLIIFSPKSVQDDYSGQDDY